MKIYTPHTKTPQQSCWVFFYKVKLGRLNEKTAAHALPIQQRNENSSLRPPVSMSIFKLAIALVTLRSAKRL